MMTGTDSQTRMETSTSEHSFMSLFLRKPPKEQTHPSKCGRNTGRTGFKGRRCPAAHLSALTRRIPVQASSTSTKQNRRDTDSENPHHKSNALLWEKGNAGSDCGHTPWIHGQGKPGLESPTVLLECHHLDLRLPSVISPSASSDKFSHHRSRKAPLMTNRHVHSQAYFVQA